MRNLVFGYGYSSEGATGSATLTASGYSATNVVDLARGTTWLSSGTTASQKLILDLGSAKTPTFLGLANCNWSVWGTTKLRHSPDGATWTDFLTLSGLPSVDSVQDWAAILTAAPSRQWWCLEWAAPSAAPEVGVFYLGTAVTLTKNPSYPTIDEDVYGVARESSEGGVVVAEELHRRLARFDLVWDPCDSTERDEILTVIRSEGGPLRPFWMIPIDESGSSSSGRAYLVRYAPTTQAVRRRFLNTYSLGLPLLEEV